MTSQGKNDDCYFYYYSSCTKGDSCPFRHCEAALGTETTCSQWREGMCYRDNCKFRHMESRINRSTIPCYWENQPTGCCKPHCVFMHMKPRPSVKSNAEIKKLILPIASNSPPVNAASHEPAVSDNADNQVSLMSSAENYSDPGDDDVHISPHPVEPFVVRFDEGEESDTESVSSTPLKSAAADLKLGSVSAKRNLSDTLSVKEDFGIKTLEQIRMEKIHKESEHFYQSTYDAPIIDSTEVPDVDYQPESYPPVSDFISLSDAPIDKTSVKDSSLLSTDAEKDLRNRLLKKKGTPLPKVKAVAPTKKTAVQPSKKDDPLNFKIKTLDEIRKAKENKSADHEEKTAASNGNSNSQPESITPQSDAISCSNTMKSTRRISLKRKSFESQSKQNSDEANLSGQSPKSDLSAAILHEVQNISEDQSLAASCGEKKRTVDVSPSFVKRLKPSIPSSISKPNGVYQSTNDAPSATLKIEGRRKIRRPVTRRDIAQDTMSAPISSKESSSNGLRPPARKHSMSPPPSSHKKMKSFDISSDCLPNQQIVSLVNSPPSAFTTTTAPSIIVTNASVIQKPMSVPTPVVAVPNLTADNHSTILVPKSISLSSSPSPKLTVSSDDKSTELRETLSSTSTSSVLVEKTVTSSKPVPVHHDSPIPKKRPSLEIIDKRKRSLQSVSEDDIESFLLGDDDLALDDVDEAHGKDTEALMSEIEQLLDS